MYTRRGETSTFSLWTLQIPNPRFWQIMRENSVEKITRQESHISISPLQIVLTSDTKKKELRRFTHQLDYSLHQPHILLHFHFDQWSSCHAFSPSSGMWLNPLSSVIWNTIPLQVKTFPPIIWNTWAFVESYHIFPRHLEYVRIALTKSALT